MLAPMEMLLKPFVILALWNQKWLTSTMVNDICTFLFVMILYLSEFYIEILRENQPAYLTRCEKHGFRPKSLIVMEAI